MLPIFALGIRRRRENLETLRYKTQIRTQSDPFNLPELRFIELFRLNKDLAHNLIEMVEPFLQQPTLLRRGISAETAVLVALRYYATGSYQRTIGQDINLSLSQTSVSRCIHRVTEVIDQHLSERFIKFPETRDQRQEVKASFMEKHGFPGVVGAIDGTHIAILKPYNDEHNFINRKGFHSLNVQLICDANQKILSILANYGGSTHDSFIWRYSNIQGYMNNLHLMGERNSWLIGDSGYPLQPYLLTPVAHALPNTPEDRYNHAHIQARSTVERTIGVLKMRFRCLLKERVARYEPHFVSMLISACAVLHNMCVRDLIPIIDDEELHEEPVIVNMENVAPVGGNPQNLYNEGLQQRHNVIERYFTN